MLAAALPDLDSLDLEAVKALLIAQHAQYTRTLSSRATEIERLLLLVEKLKHMLFGKKSEKVLRQIEQLELQIEDLVVATVVEEIQAVPQAEHPAPARPFRRPLPEHLPREIHTHMPAHEACPDCGGRLRELGEDVAEMLEYVRASFKVLRHVRPKLSCDACDRIVQAPAPSRPIDRGLAGPGLLAHVLVSKYADHQPLYRQSEIYAREGVDLDRSTLAGWVGATSELLTPLVEAVRDHVMAASKLHADDTPVPVLAPGNGKTKTGRLWTYVRDDRPSGDMTAPAVWFAYSPDRKGERPEALPGCASSRCLCGLPSSLRTRNDLRSGLLGTCPAQVPRDPYRSRFFNDFRSYRAHSRTLRHQRRDPRQHARDQKNHPASQGKAGARQHAHVARSHANETLAEVRHCGCNPLRALALACAEPLCRRWTSRDRQQRRRTGTAGGRARSQELPLRRLRRRRRTRRRHVLAARLS